MLLLQVTAGGGLRAHPHAAAAGACPVLAPMLVVQRVEASAAGGVSGSWLAPLHPGAP